MLERLRATLFGLEKAKAVPTDDWLSAPAPVSKKRKKKSSLIVESNLFPNHKLLLKSHFEKLLLWNNFDDSLKVSQINYVSRNKVHCTANLNFRLI